MRRNTWLLAVVLMAVAGLGATSVAHAAPPTKKKNTAKLRATLGGTWSGKYGGAFSGTFTLHWKQSGSKLNGSIVLSRPRGTYGIGGNVTGKAIKFGAVGVGAKYTGSVSGSSMSGTYTSPQGGGTWSAHKTSSARIAVAPGTKSKQHK